MPNEALETTPPYTGELLETDVVIYHQVGIPAPDEARAAALGFGKKSGNLRLTRALRIAFRRYMDDIAAGRVRAPEWGD